jgi:hypothetical protein
MRWIRRLLGIERQIKRPSTAKQIDAGFNASQTQIKEAGAVEGAHYTDYVEQVKQLKSEKRHAEAIALLLVLVDATETESTAAGAGWGVAPWYYEQLAILYRKEKQFADEVAILERYEAQPKAPGAGPGKLAERLTKARELAAAEH